MLDVSDAHRFRKTVAGICMIGAPLLFLLGALVGPGVDADEATMGRLIADEPGAWMLSQALILTGWALFIPAVLGMVHMLRERGVAEGHTGGAIALIGVVAAIAQSGFGLTVGRLGEISTEAATSALNAVADGLASFVLFALPIGVTIGGVILAWALYRNGFVAAWIAAAIGLSGLLFALASLLMAQELFIAAAAVASAGFTALGRIILRESTEAWEHTPQVRITH